MTSESFLEKWQHMESFSQEMWERGNQWCHLHEAIEKRWERPIGAESHCETFCKEWDEQRQYFLDLAVRSDLHSFFLKFEPAQFAKWSFKDTDFEVYLTSHLQSLTQTKFKNPRVRVTTPTREFWMDIPEMDSPSGIFPDMPLGLKRDFPHGFQSIFQRTPDQTPRDQTSQDRRPNDLKPYDPEPHHQKPLIHKPLIQKEPKEFSSDWPSSWLTPFPSFFTEGNLPSFSGRPISLPFLPNLGEHPPLGSTRQGSPWEMPLGSKTDPAQTTPTPSGHSPRERATPTTLGSTAPLGPLRDVPETTVSFPFHLNVSSAFGFGSSLWAQEPERAPLRTSGEWGPRPDFKARLPLLEGFMGGRQDPPSATGNLPQAPGLGNFAGLAGGMLSLPWLGSTSSAGVFEPAARQNLGGTLWQGVPHQGSPWQGTPWQSNPLQTPLWKSSQGQSTPWQSSPWQSSPWQGNGLESPLSPTSPQKASDWAEELLKPRHFKPWIQWGKNESQPNSQGWSWGPKLPTSSPKKGTAPTPLSALIKEFIESLRQFGEGDGVWDILHPQKPEPGSPRGGKRSAIDVFLSLIKKEEEKSKESKGSSPSAPGADRQNSVGEMSKLIKAALELMKSPSEGDAKGDSDPNSLMNQAKSCIGMADNANEFLKSLSIQGALLLDAVVPVLEESAAAFEGAKTFLNESSALFAQIRTVMNCENLKSLEQDFEGAARGMAETMVEKGTVALKDWSKGLLVEASKQTKDTIESSFIMVKETLKEEAKEALAPIVKLLESWGITPENLTPDSIRDVLKEKFGGLAHDLANSTADGAIEGLGSGSRKWLERASRATKMLRKGDTKGLQEAAIQELKKELGIQKVDADPVSLDLLVERLIWRVEERMRLDQLAKGAGGALRWH